MVLLLQHFQDWIDGLKTDKDKPDTYRDIYPLSGITLCTHKREQVKKKNPFSNSICPFFYVTEHYLLFIRLDVGTHLMIHYQISSKVYLVNLGINSDVE